MDAIGTTHHPGPWPRLPVAGYLRLPQVLGVIPVSRSTWWAGVRAGRYPPAVRLGPGITAWRAQDIARLIELLDRGRDWRETQQERQP